MLFIAFLSLVGEIRGSMLLVRSRGVCAPESKLTIAAISVVQKQSKATRGLWRFYADISFDPTTQRP